MLEFLVAIWTSIGVPHQLGIFRPAHNANAPLLAFESKKARLAPTWAIGFDITARSGVCAALSPITRFQVTDRDQWFSDTTKKDIQMTKVEDNKAIVGRWFTDFWGKSCQLSIVDELAAPEMLLQYSLHEPRRGRDDIKAFMTDFRTAFPDLNFWGTADLIAEGDYVVGRWEGGGTHTGPAFSDFLIGSLPAASGRKMRFTGTTVLRLQNGKIVEEIGLDDGVTALTQLGLLKAA
jgi:predicted ester cyclase